MSDNTRPGSVMPYKIEGPPPEVAKPIFHAVSVTFTDGSVKRFECSNISNKFSIGTVTLLKLGKVVAQVEKATIRYVEYIYPEPAPEIKSEVELEYDCHVPDF